MNEQIRMLKERADAARLLYKQNKMTRAEAHAEIAPYVVAFNNVSERIAKKYNQKPKTMSIISYLR